MIEIIALIVVLATCLFAGYTIYNADRIIRKQRNRIVELEKLLVICYHEAFPHIKQKIKEVLES